MSNSEKTNKESIEETIARIRNNRKHNSFTHHISEKPKGLSLTDEKLSIKRVSKKNKSVDTLDRKRVINLIAQQLLMGELTQGEALKELRIKVLGLKQEAYANFVHVSRKTISDVENDRGSSQTDILNKLFKPFGLKVGLIPVSSSMLFSVLNSDIGK